MKGIYKGLVLTAVALGAPLAACEGDDGGSSGGGAFDAGSFDGNGGTMTADGAMGDGDTPNEAGSDGGGPPPPTADDVYVDPAAGLDTNTGKAGSPFKTITKGLATVPAGSGVHLLDGTFDVTSEGSNAVLTIPNNVILRAENPGGPVIAGLTIAANENAGIYDIMFDFGAQVTSKAVAAGPALTISGATFLNEMLTNTGLTIGGFSRATITNVTISGIVRVAVQVKDDAVVTFSGGTLDGSNFGTNVIGSGLFSVNNRASLVLDAMTVKNSMFPGIFVTGDTPATPAKLTIRNGATMDTVGSADTCGGSVVVGPVATVVVDHSTVKGSPGQAVCVADGTVNANVSIVNGSVLTNNGTGISTGVTGAVGIAVTVSDATITGNIGYGIRWLATGTFSLSTSTISGSPDGLFLSGGGAGLTFTARNNQIKTNGYGIEAFATNVGDLTLDFGTGAAPGGNTITGNTMGGINFSVGEDVVGNAQGNTWNANVQNADAAGHFAAGTVGTPVSPSGTNFRLPSSGTLNL